jgi:hypothetical protein
MTVSIYRANRSTVLATLAVLGLLIVALLTLGAAFARAETIYSPVGSFGAFAAPAGVAVDNSTGPSKNSVYVIDIGHGRLAKFSSTGTPANFSASGTPEISAGPGGPFVQLRYVAVDDSNGASKGDIYISDTEGHAVYKYNPAGEFVSKIEGGVVGAATFQPTGLAVNPENGDLYVAGLSPGTVYKLEEESHEHWKLLKTFEAGHAPNADSIAAGQHGEVYVTNQGESIAKFSAEGAFEATLPTAVAPQSVAVDPSNGDVFVGEHSESPEFAIAHYNSAGTSLLSPVFGKGEIAGGSFGIAVDAETHDVYGSAIGGTTVTYYSAETPLAKATTEAPTEVTTTTAKLNGKIQLNVKSEAKYYFEYSKAGEPAVKTAETAVEGEGEHVVSEAVSSLEPGTPYHVQLFVVAEGKTFNGGELAFETLPLASPTTETPNPIAAESATFHGKAVLHVAGPAEYYFAYGKGNVTEKTTTPKPLTEETVTEPVTGLEPGTKYQVQLVIIVESQHVTGSGDAPVEFETPTLVTVTTEAATEPGAESAKLNGKIKTGPTGGSYYFEYAQEESGAFTNFAKTEEKTIVGEQELAVSATVKSLTPHSKYRFKLVAKATGSAAVVEGALLEFETLTAKPKVVSESAGNEERHSAALSGEINPEGTETRYYFEYATEEAYGEAVRQNKPNPYGEVPTGEGGTTSEATTAATTGPVKVGPVTAIELHAGTVYHYRLVAANATGTAYGPDQTFETEEPQFPFVEAVRHQVTSPTTATIEAKVNADGLPTSYILEIGTEVVNGRPVYSTPTFGEVGSGSEPVVLEFHLTNLLPGTTYHYRVVVFNEDGTFLGGDHTFETGTFPSVIAAPATVPLVPIPVEVKVTPPKPTTPKETNAQKLTKALKLCKKQPKKTQAACNRRAEKKYGPKKPKKKAKKK